VTFSDYVCFYLTNCSILNVLFHIYICTFAITYLLMFMLLFILSGTTKTKQQRVTGALAAAALFLQHCRYMHLKRRGHTSTSALVGQSRLVRHASRRASATNYNAIRQQSPTTTTTHFDVVTPQAQPIRTLYSAKKASVLREKIYGKRCRIIATTLYSTVVAFICHKSQLVYYVDNVKDKQKTTVKKRGNR